MRAPIVNAMTIDVEDYFQVSACARDVRRKRRDLEIVFHVDRHRIDHG